MLRRHAAAETHIVAHTQRLYAAYLASMRESLLLWGELHNLQMELEASVRTFSGSWRPYVHLRECEDRYDDCKARCSADHARYVEARGRQEKCRANYERRLALWEGLRVEDESGQARSGE